MPCKFKLPISSAAKWLGTACSVLAIFGSANTSQAAGPAWLDDVLARHVKRHNLVYATLYIQTENQQYLHRTVSPELDQLLPDADLPAVGKTRYRWGEIAHVWLSLSALAVEDSGKLDTTAKLGRYLYGEPYNSVKNLKDVTLIDLITQDAGIPDYSDNSAFFRRVMNNGKSKHWTRDTLLALVSKLDPYDQPGKSVWPSKSHDLLIAATIEKLTGKSWQNQAKQTILTPAKLSNTGFGREQKNLLPGLQDIDFAEDEKKERLDTRSLAQAIPGQDVAGDIIDLDRFLRWLVDSSAKPPTLLRGLAGQPLDGTGTGLIRLTDTPETGWSLFGHQPGWQAEAIYVPGKDISVTLLSAGSSAREIAPALLEILQTCACIPENPRISSQATPADQKN